MIKVIVCGGCGRMASKVAQLLFQDKQIELLGIIESPAHPDIGKDGEQLWVLGMPGL